MPKTVIIYGTNYGTTKQYANELANRMGLHAVSYDKVQLPEECEAIIYFGGLYAGGVKGLKETAAKLGKVNYGNLIIATVGLADVKDSKNIENIRRSLSGQIPKDMYEKASIFHLRGGIDYRKLNFMHKTMMKLLYNKAKNLPQEKQTAEVRAMIETYGKQVDFVDFKELDEIQKKLNTLGIYGTKNE